VVDLTDLGTVTWANQALRLFHGTDANAATSIIKNVDLPRNPTRVGGWDFGRGVYFHISQQPAEEWAQRRTSGKPKKPQVVEITVDRARFGALRSLVFLDAPSICDLRDPFWQYVNFCRSGTRAGAGPRSGAQIVADPYDIAMGPLVHLGHPPDQEPYIELTPTPETPGVPRIYQICFKTTAAVTLLNHSTRQRVWP
jgi:hypothetical protein